MKKHDLIIIAGVVAIALVAFGIFHLMNNKGSGLLLRVSQNGEVIRTLPLDQDHTETITTALGSNTIIIKDQSALVESADCDNQVCVHSPAIKAPGETIACLPHRLILEIIQEP
ncbi:NusG domain II-containing protein [Eubacterium sp. 1001713B170207_170306_E7]|uniref:NusG domain II-containing protein n=1 Tax=Eubacterium sp. 1001713B170207_170306_E7 TaxID=2787097 RepID=UPI0018993B86|nr:NusG domain II-containing protein [Eubacterium sp. 1001713B170207_170306_E7]